ncbi:MAG: DoxX family protein [Burkholderiales bacterium]|nr:MAG: DoxX family protein [Burkholderiales bacterium]
MNPQAISLVIARILLAVIFVVSGFGKFANLAGTAGYIASAGLPLPQVLAVAAAALEVIGGVLLIVGWQARGAALALAGFTLVASLLFHNFWALPAEQQFMQQLMFMKNLAITGGLLFVFGAGPGGLSFDARRTAAA